MENGIERRKARMSDDAFDRIIHRAADAAVKRLETDDDFKARIAQAASRIVEEKFFAQVGRKGIRLGGAAIGGIIVWEITKVLGVRAGGIAEAIARMFE